MVLPFDVVCEIWDNYINEGEIYLYKSALGMLRYFGTSLIKSTFEQAMQLLKNIPKDLDRKELIMSIEAINVPPFVYGFVNKINVPLTKP